MSKIEFQRHTKLKVLTQIEPSERELNADDTLIQSQNCRWKNADGPDARFSTTLK